MRNLSFSEATLAIICIFLGSGLAYLAWFRPAFEQMHSDRQATQTLLFELASARQEIAANIKHEQDAALVPITVPEAQKPIKPSGRTHQRVISGPRRPRQELELDEGSDPLADLEMK